MVSAELGDHTDCPSTQVQQGVKSVSDPHGDGAVAVATIETLEGYKIVLRMDCGGVRIESAGDDCTYSRCSYDCVNSFLLNNSPGFAAYFNSSLAAALARVAEEQQEDSRDPHDS